MHSDLKYRVFDFKTYLDSGQPLDEEGFERCHTYPFAVLN